MIKNFFVFGTLIMFLTGCTTFSIPSDFQYRSIQTKTFRLATWIKESDPLDGFRVYIEGDGYAFNAHGRASHDPTPRDTLVRELAFQDQYKNVIYIARPCQYREKDPMCAPTYWTDARFSEPVIAAMSQAINQLVQNRPVKLIGYSGGAQVAGLVAVKSEDLKVKKIITIAGNLDHERWTEYHHLPSLSASLTLKAHQEAFMRFDQVHFVGQKDSNIPPFLVRDFVGDRYPVFEIKGATHNRGWKKNFDHIWQE